MSKEKDKERAGVDSVTDYVEETAADSAMASCSLSGLNNVTEASSSAASVVTIDSKDVDLIVEECEVTRLQAEALLRRYSGNLLLSLDACVRGERF